MQLRRFPILVVGLLSLATILAAGEGVLPRLGAIVGGDVPGHVQACLALPIGAASVDLASLEAAAESPWEHSGESRLAEATRRQAAGDADAAAHDVTAATGREDRVRQGTDAGTHEDLVRRNRERSVVADREVRAALEAARRAAEEIERSLAKPDH